MLRRRTILPASLLFVVLWTVFGLLFLPPVGGDSFDLRLEVHPNDLAAGLVLLLPGCATFALAGRGRRRWLALAATALLAALLFATGSRGGLVAAVAGLVVSSSFLGRRGRRALLVLAAACALVVAALSAAVGGDELRRQARAALRDHDAEGATWDHLLSGRPRIWRQAGLVVRDLPLFGASLRGYRELVPDAYPMPPGSLYEAARTPGPRVDDSHQFFLELALVHGVPGALVLLGIVVAAVVRLLRRLRRGDLQARDRALDAGIFGGLVAHLAHGLGDVAASGAVPFGTAVHLLFWLFVGLALRDSPSSRPGAGSWRAAGVSALVAVAGLAAVAETTGRLSTEAKHRRAIQALDRAEPSTELRSGLTDGPCRSRWWRHLLAHRAGEEDQAVESLRSLASCDPARIRDLRALAPFDLARAAAAADVTPGHPDVLLWRAWALRRASRPTDRSAERAGEREDHEREEVELRRLYDRYLAARPEDAKIWLEAARGLRRGERWRLAALTRACVQGDPGANACYGAGRLARRMDLPAEVVLHLLRLSEWRGALDLADEIEADETEAAERRKSTAVLTKAPPPPV